MPDPPPDVPKIPAVLKWDDGGVIREHVIREEHSGLVAMVAEVDPLLEDFVARHGHGLSDVRGLDEIKIWACDQATYDALDATQFVKDQLQSATDELMTEVNFYKDEALACYNQHGNPDLKKGCIDFLDDSKIIGSKKVPPNARVYKCHMCPYMQTYIAVEMRHKEDLYRNPQKYMAKQRAAQARQRAQQRRRRR
jgi:hypothetical protein